MNVVKIESIKLEVLKVTFLLEQFFLKYLVLEQHDFITTSRLKNKQQNGIDKFDNY